MIARISAGLLLLWLLGFVWFAVALPQPVGEMTTDAVIVPTGGAGRIERGLEILDAGLAKEMFVSGVDREVKPGEFEDQFNVEAAQMRCCVTLGYAAVDTRSNAKEAAQWVRERGYSTVRLVTTDWHMRRARSEFRNALPKEIARWRRMR